MNDPKKTAQFSVSMTPAELERLDDWSFGQRIRSRSEAIRQLITLGLAAHEAGWRPSEEGDNEGQP